MNTLVDNITYNWNTNIVDISEIQIIDGDQKDDFPLWEVHIKKIDRPHVYNCLVFVIEI